MLGNRWEINTNVIWEHQKVIRNENFDIYQNYHFWKDLQSKSTKYEQIIILCLLHISYINFRNTRKRFFSSNDDSIDYFVENTSNSPKHQIDYQEHSDDYHNYNETTVETIPNEYFDDADEEETPTAFTPAKKQKIFLDIKEDPIYCKNETTESNYHDDNEARHNGETENSANELFGTLSDLLTKRFQTEENDNDLFLKMIGKKMKTLPTLVQNSLQERFLKDVNEEIRKFSDCR